MVDRSGPALTVGHMTVTAPAHAPYQQLRELELGDILALPDGRQLTVRAVEPALNVPVGPMAGFILAGEVGPQATLLSVPPAPNGPVGIYTPLDRIPASAAAAVPVCEGAVSYWAPHLPNVSGAMGELGYRVCRVRGQIDPLVLIWRGPERVVFVRSAVTSAGHLSMVMMPRDRAATEVDQARHAAVVTTPAHVPAPVEVPQRAGAWAPLRR